MQRIFILLSLAFMSLNAQAQVVINEYSCSNVNGPTDAFGQREDWVELLNTGASAVNLTGYYLSDDKFTTQKWQIPAGVTIPANGRMMVYCSDRGVFQGGQLHPTFKLTQTRGTEYFVLANTSGVIVDTVKLIPAQVNHSRGRRTDGSNLWGVFNTPTPGAANANAKDGYATKPVFDVAAGFYATPQSVNLSSPDPNVQIRYTVDGSVPTAASTLFGAPIAIPATMPVRAVAFSSNPLVLPSFTETNTYFINETIAPTMNIIAACGDYNNLFNGWGGGNGIGTSVEFFEYTNHQQKFEFEGISRGHGHDSWAYPQKSFRLYTEDEYGYDYAMKYQFFNNSTRDTFQQVILKAGASDNYPFMNQYSGLPSCHIRDAFAHTLAQKYNLKMDSRKYAPTVVYLNGQYWGLYEIREKVNGDYTDYYYDQSKKKIDLLSYWGGLEVREGSDTGWNNLYTYIMNNNQAVPANYQHVKNFLDVEGFVQYFIYNTWLVNSDWLNWNTMWWRGRKGQGVKWRYACWDMDNVCGLGQNFTGWPTTGYQADPCKPFEFFQNNSTIKHTDMLVHLMDNPEFEQMYRQTFIDMLNGPLNCNNMVPHFDSIVNIIRPEMQHHINRWGNATYNYAQWDANITNMRNWLLTRCQLIAQKLDSCMDLNPQQISFDVYPPQSGVVAWDGNIMNPPNPWTKIIEADSLLNLSAIPANGYYFFDHWENYESMNDYTPDSLTNPIGFDFHKKDSIVAVFRYFNPDSVWVTFDVTPPGKGTIALNNAVIGSYPYTVKIDRRYSYTLNAAATANSYMFFNWRKNKATSNLASSLFNTDVTFTFNEEDTIVANFQYDPPPGNLPSSPILPELDQNMAIPSAFSPNGDGKNDVFHILTGKHIKAVDMKVYDRWGNMVFNTIDPRGGWDGTFKGKPAEIGTYFYVLTVWFDNTIQNSNKMYRGEINLIR